MEPIQEQIRRLMIESGRSRNSIAIQTGLDPTQLHRLAHGQPGGGSIEIIERVAAALGHRVALVPLNPPTSSKPTKPRKRKAR